MKRLRLVPLLIVLMLCAVSRAAEDHPREVLHPVYMQQVRMHGFWRDQVKRLTVKWIPHCVRQMEAGGKGQELLNLEHTARVLRGETAGNFTGCPWSDAYVYNTIEAICLALSVDPEGDQQLADAQASLRKTLEEWIPIVLSAQMSDGYIHSYHVVNRLPRYEQTSKHEFYVQGYFIEAGVAHYRLTGGTDRRLYDAARKCAHHLCATFGPAPRRNWVHGHAGMAIALCRLARLVDEVEGEGQGRNYADLAKFLFDHRHTIKAQRSPYNQSHRPVAEMEHAVGHAVRATYFYGGIADLAMLQHDAAYGAAADRTWESAVHRRMYITGGVGSTHQGEAFGADYDLPNNSAYCESCAGCGLSFWADRMNRMHADATYVDIQERVLYNNILGAVALQGETFFYQNPLGAAQARYPWHGCPCCVGNIPRALIAIKDAMYAVNTARDAVYVNHFVAGEGTIADVAGSSLRLVQETDYPWKGDVALTLHPAGGKARFALHVRIPGRAESALYSAEPDLADRMPRIRVNGRDVNGARRRGYAVIEREWARGDRVDLLLPMDIQRIRADERVTADRGRVALQRGPLVYSVEAVDVKRDMRTLVVAPDAPLTAVWREDLLDGVMAIRGVDHDVLAVPNYARLNRGGWSQVWVMEDLAKLDADTRAAIARERELASLTIDSVAIGDHESELAHALRGERTAAGSFNGRSWRHAGAGHFGYDLQVEAGVTNVLLCTWWGSDGGNRKFDICVGGQTIATQVLQNNRPGVFFDVEYPIPAALVQGREAIRVEFRSVGQATAGGIFGLRTIRKHRP